MRPRPGEACGTAKLGIVSGAPSQGCSTTPVSLDPPDSDDAPVSTSLVPPVPALTPVVDDDSPVAAEVEPPPPSPLEPHASADTRSAERRGARCVTRPTRAASRTVGNLSATRAR